MGLFPYFGSSCVVVLAKFSDCLPGEDEEDEEEEAQEMEALVTHKNKKSKTI